MKKIISSGIVTGLVLLLLAYVALWIMPILLPKVAEEYYSPAFVNDASRNALYFVHPFFLAFGLSWFWRRFKSQLKGNAWMQGIEMAFIYLLTAIVPSLLITFSAINVSVFTILSWLLYGFIQALIAGFIFARMQV